MLSAIQQRIMSQMAIISNTESRIPMLLERRITSERHRLEMLEEKEKALDPTLLLKRGYSITFFKGKVVKDPLVLHKGDEIETRIEKGTIKSIIK
jgi:exodeoxyribonuclease VII large subunit